MDSTSRTRKEQQEQQQHKSGFPDDSFHWSDHWAHVIKPKIVMYNVSSFWLSQILACSLLLHWTPKRCPGIRLSRFGTQPFSETYLEWAALRDSICLCLCFCKLFRGGIDPEPLDWGKIQFILAGRNENAWISRWCQFEEAWRNETENSRNTQRHH